MEIQSMKSRWWAVIGLGILFLNAGIDFTIISTALPTIQTMLNLSLIQLQWVMNIYLLLNCIFLAAMGRLADLYGHRLMLYISIALFFSATLIAGFATSFKELLVGRGLQGIVEAILLPSSLALISNLFQGPERGKAIGIWSSFIGIGMVLGAGLSGYIISLLGWRWTFFIKLPILVLGLIICILTLPKSKAVQKATFDWPGFLAISISVACLVIPIVQGTEWGWSSAKTLILFAVSFIGFVTFYYVESRSKNPIMQLSLLRNRWFLACAAAQFVLVFFICTIMFLAPLYLQNVRNIPVTDMGLIFMIAPLALFISSLISGYIIDKIGAERLILLTLVSLILSATLQLFFTPQTPILMIIVAFILLGISWGAGLSSTATAALNAIPESFAGVSIGVLWTIQIAGGSIGLALSGALFRYQEAQSLINALRAAHISLSPTQTSLIHSLLSEPDHAKQTLNQLGIVLSERILPLFKTSFLYGYASTMILLLLLSLGGLLFVKQSIKK